MLTRRHPNNAGIKPRARQNGVVLMIALIILVAMTLAGIALVRSVDTTNVIAGNLAFQQGATHAGDQGIEAAITCLTANNTGNTLWNNVTACGYFAAGGNAVPGSTQTWDAYWAASLDGGAITLSADVGGNTVKYVIHRLCQTSGDPVYSNCSFAPVVCDPDGSHRGGSGSCLKSTPQLYYRITSQITGPRNTTSYIQSIIAL